MSIIIHRNVSESSDDIADTPASESPTPFGTHDADVASAAPPSVEPGTIEAADPFEDLKKRAHPFE
ncbi:MAG: hypothetical protein H0V12_00775 [Chloroflexi bacterium]|nr:hypothetical protein [Chloroflexota bacterium]